MTFTGASVIVANANGQSGTAGKVTTVLDNGTDFTLVAATDSSSDEVLATSQILYNTTNAAALPVAETLAQVLPGSFVPTPISGTAPVKDGELGGADVVLMLGSDLVNITMAQLNVPSAVTTSDTVATSSTPATSG